MSLLKKDFAIKTEQVFEENVEIHKHVSVFSLEKRQIKMAYNWYVWFRCGICQNSLSSSVKRWSKSEKFIKKLPDLGIFWTRKKQMLNVFYLFTRTLNYIYEDKHLAHNYDEVCCVIHLYDVFQNWNLAVLLKILSNFTFKYREWTWISGFRRNVDYRRNKCRFTNIQSALQRISGIISKRYSRTKCYGLCTLYLTYEFYVLR